MEKKWSIIYLVPYRSCTPFMHTQECSRPTPKIPGQSDQKCPRYEDSEITHKATHPDTHPSIQNLHTHTKTHSTQCTLTILILGSSPKNWSKTAKNTTHSTTPTTHPLTHTITHTQNLGPIRQKMFEIWSIEDDPFPRIQNGTRGHHSVAYN